MTQIRKIWTSKFTNDVDEYVGREGEIFYTSGAVELRFSDGVTPGGILFSPGSGGSGGAGVSGYSGYSGYSGAPGLTGQSGRSGYSGSPGVPGASGYSGMDGTPGASGSSGYSGSPGVPGASGYSGMDGTPGASGSSGYSGSPGVPGTSGYSGMDGMSGYSGASGLTGNSGVSGWSGHSGFSGLLGSTGPTGAVGAAGQNGISSGLVLYLDDVGGTSPTNGSLLLIPNNGPQTNVTTSVNAGSGTLISTWLTGVGIPGVTAVVGGNWNVWLYASRSGAGDVRFWAVIDEVGSDGTTLLQNLVTGNYANGTPINTSSSTLFEFSAYVPVTTLASTASRIRVTLYAQSATGIPLLTSYYRNGTISYLVTTISANVSGPTGPIGPTGENGFSGYSGYSGAAGSNGASGISGYSGYSGSAGSDGASGVSGFSGFIGPTGPTGQLGSSGTSGYSGYGGLTGASGLSGWSGNTGNSGASGYSGAGTSGFSGFSGQAGSSAQITATNTTANSVFYPVFVDVAGSSTLPRIRSTATAFAFNPGTGEVSAVDFNSLSDIIYKTNIEEITNCWDLLKDLRPVSFDWKHANKHSFGLVAQEVEKNIPSIVSTNETGKTVAYIQLIPLLLKALQDQAQAIENIQKYLGLNK